MTISAEDLKKKPAELDKELETLQTEYEAIENEIELPVRVTRRYRPTSRLTLAEVQQKVLDDQTVLLEYALRTDGSYLWAVSKSSVALHKLPPRLAIDQLATDLRSQLIPSKLQRRIVGIDVAEANRGLGVAAAAPEDTAAFVAASNAVYKAVMEPAAAMIADKRLLIVADSALNYIPFEVLLKSADPGDFASLGYLVKTNEVVYAPSASVVGFIKQQRGQASGRSMLIIADPVFNSNDARAQKAPTTTAPAEVRGLGIQSALTDVTGQASPAAPSGQMVGLPLARSDGNANGSRADLSTGRKLRVARLMFGSTSTQMKTTSLRVTSASIESSTLRPMVC